MVGPIDYATILEDEHANASVWAPYLVEQAIEQAGARIIPRAAVAELSRAAEARAR